jgi:hypothetical protein
MYKIILIIILLTACAPTIDTNRITDGYCDDMTPCPGDYGCYLFPGYNAPICADQNPCTYFFCPLGRRCVVDENYPASVNCI